MRLMAFKVLTMNFNVQVRLGTLAVCSVYMAIPRVSEKLFVGRVLKCTCLPGLFIFDFEVYILWFVQFVPAFLSSFFSSVKHFLTTVLKSAL